MKRIFLLCFWSLSLQAQVYQDSLTYEQRYYRNPFEGFEKLGKGRVPLWQGVPLVRIGETVENLSQREQKDLGVKGWFPMAFDFWLQPQFIARFGNYENPVESKTNLLLNAQINIRKGWVAYTGLTIPIQNDLDSQPLKLRLAPTYLHYFGRTGEHDFWAASGGLFFSDQYGLNVQYRRTDFISPWSWGAELGYTGYYRWMPGVFEYGQLKHFLALADITWRWQKHDVSIKLSGGQFMHQDKGARVDFIRQFQRAEVGLFGVSTQNGASIGFQLAFPIPPGKLYESKGLNFRTSDEFRWEYLYTRGYRIGEKPRLHYQLDDRLRQYHRSYGQNTKRR